MEADVAAALADVVARVTRLEQATASTPAIGPGRRGEGELVAGTEPVPDHGRVVYAGGGPWEGSTVAWQMERSWEDVLSQAGEHVARVVSALGSGVRLRIVGQLVSGPMTTGALAERLDQPTSGQLFHHLKELLAVGVVHQPRRGTYALRPQHVLPVLAVLSAASDLASTSDAEPW